jgi:MarR family transcriptional regulator, negative regulator of the multidrug operon emrRAB
MRGADRLRVLNRSTALMAKAVPDLPMAETVMVRLIRISVMGLGQYFEPLFRIENVPENSFHVLCLLLASETGTASPSELSEMVGSSRANMTRILEAMVKEKLVTRSVVERDARRHSIKITARGRSVAEDMVPRLAQPLKHAFSDLSPAEFAQLSRLLRKMIGSFDKDATPLRKSA